MLSGRLVSADRHDNPEASSNRMDDGVTVTLFVIFVTIGTRAGCKMSACTDRSRSRYPRLLDTLLSDCCAKPDYETSWMTMPPVFTFGMIAGVGSPPGPNRSDVLYLCCIDIIRVLRLPPRNTWLGHASSPWAKHPMAQGTTYEEAEEEEEEVGVSCGPLLHQ